MRGRLFVLLAAALSLGAGKPLSISLTPSSQTITEGQGATLLLGKSGGNGRVTAAKVTTSDGSWSGSIVLGSSFTVPTVDDMLVNGTRTITVTAIASTGATAKATFTVLDNDVPPPPAPSVTWTKCADENGTCTIIGTANVRYGSGTTWLIRLVTGSISCSNSVFGDPLPGIVKECDTDGTAVVPAPAPAPAPTPVPAPTPAPAPAPVGSWVSAPLAVGGYACNRLQAATPNVPPCGGGIVYKITSAVMSSDAVPVQLYAASFYQDVSGNFPVNDAYQVAFTGYWKATDLVGIAPAP